MNLNKFIAQTFRDILNLYNIDSYRPKYANSHVILEEIKYVCSNIELGTVKESYLKKLIEEARHILQKDEVLKKYYGKNIGFTLHSLSSYENPTFLKQTIDIQLKYFKNDYFNNLASEILSRCDNRSKTEVSLEMKNETVNIINSLITECIFKGVSFKYLSKLALLENNFSKTKLSKIFKKLSGKSKFNLYLKLENVDEKIVEFFVKGFGNKDRVKVSKKWPINVNLLPNYLKIKKHAKDRTLIFYTHRGSHKDKYSALFHFRNNLEYIINLSHVLSPVRHLRFNNKGLVYDYSERKYKGIDYEHLVDYKKKRNYLDFEDKLMYCHAINKKIRNKIETSVSYLDTSLNEFKLINKYLNSWISLEVLFNGIGQEEKTNEYSTADYIQKYIPCVSSIFYVKKIIDHLLQRIVALNLADHGKCFLDKDSRIKTSGFLEYINNDEKFNLLIIDLKDEEELINKLINIRDVLRDKRKLEKFLQAHNERIGQHLKRLYRMRNDFVHGGEQLINSRGLFNSSFVEMLSLNCQEYTTEFVEKTSEFCFKKKEKNSQDIERMIDVCEAFHALFKSIIVKLSKDLFNDDDLEKLLTPNDFFFKN